MTRTRPRKTSSSFFFLRYEPQSLLKSGQPAFQVIAVYRQVFEVPKFIYFEPFLDALSLRTDFIRSITVGRKDFLAEE